MAKLLSRLERRWRDARSRRLVPPGPLHVAHARVSGHHLLVRDNEDVGRAIHFTHDFETAETRYLDRVTQPGATCLDVGANVGYFTMVMAGKATAGTVYAFEPLPLNAALIAASVEMNGFNNVRLVRTAVGADTGEVVFNQAADSAYSSIHDTGRKPLARQLTVPIVSLDNFLTAEAIGPVDVMKCDVEGAEGLVLDGAAALLAAPERQPAAIMIELYQPNLNLFGVTVAALMGQLAAAGYSAHTLAENGTLIAHDSRSPTARYNFVFLAARGRAMFR